MKFLQIYAITLVIGFVFAFFGGWILFDPSRNLYLTIAAWALILAAILTLLEAQNSKIKDLEKRIHELEKKNGSEAE